MICLRVPSLWLLATVALVLCSVGADTHEEEHEHHRLARAIGGREFRRGTFPWMVLLKATIVTRRFFGIPISHYHMYCGAALISDQWLLTAAHCFTDHGAAARQPGVWEARMGTSRIRPTLGQRVTDLLGRVINDNDFRQWEIDVANIIIHPNFVNTETDIRNDIAVVKLSRRIPNMQAVGPIAAPDYGGPAFPMQGTNCITAGWGCTRSGGSPSTWAHQVPMPILPAPVCQRTYDMTSMRGRLCAGHRQGGMGVCMGDSGGPLVCRHNNSVTASTINNSDSDYMLAGIVSFTSLLNPESFPAVFTKVQDYMPWIARTMRNNQ